MNMIMMAIFPDGRLLVKDFSVNGLALTLNSSCPETRFDLFGYGDAEVVMLFV